MSLAAHVSPKGASLSWLGRKKAGRVNFRVIK